eukprot:284814871_4
MTSYYTVFPTTVCTSAVRFSVGLIPSVFPGGVTLVRLAMCSRMQHPLALLGSSVIAQVVVLKTPDAVDLLRHIFKWRHVGVSGTKTSSTNIFWMGCRMTAAEELLLLSTCTKEHNSSSESIEIPTSGRSNSGGVGGALDGFSAVGFCGYTVCAFCYSPSSYKGFEIIQPCLIRMNTTSCLSSTPATSYSPSHYFSYLTCCIAVKCLQLFFVIVQVCCTLSSISMRGSLLKLRRYGILIIAEKFELYAIACAAPGTRTLCIVGITRVIFNF